MDLSKFNNSDYQRGAGILRRIIWYFFNAVFFDTWFFPSSAAKRFLLRAFGARVGRNVVIQARVNIKCPWRLAIGANSWIGEQVWIDNIDVVHIGANVCISQGAYLFTGNHDYRDEAFGLFTRAIAIEDSAWIGAFATVCPGVTVRRESVLSVRSVASSDTEAGWIYKGSPAAKVRRRYPARATTDKAAH
jgi:putative colanic acid biosynthesis acetyltransferase WcaF